MLVQKLKNKYARRSRILERKSRELIWSPVQMDGVHYTYNAMNALTAIADGLDGDYSCAVTCDLCNTASGADCMAATCACQTCLWNKWKGDPCHFVEPYQEALCEHGCCCDGCPCQGGSGGTAGGGGTYGPSGARPIPIGGTTGP